MLQIFLIGGTIFLEAIFLRSIYTRAQIVSQLPIPAKYRNSILSALWIGWTISLVLFILSQIWILENV